MPEYLVTYTSMLIEADSEEAAIDRAGDFKGGGNWEAELVSDGQEKTFTAFGVWDEDDRLVIDWVLPGDHEDHRPEFVTGGQSWCASTTATTEAEARAQLLNEYDKEGQDSD